MKCNTELLTKFSLHCNILLSTVVKCSLDVHALKVSKLIVFSKVQFQYHEATWMNEKGYLFLNMD